MKSAKSILVVGAGLVGLEMIGELAYGCKGQKKLGICTRGNRLLPHLPPKAGVLAEAYLKQNDVKIHYNTAFDTSF